MTKECGTCSTLSRYCSNGRGLFHLIAHISSSGESLIMLLSNQFSPQWLHMCLALARFERRANGLWLLHFSRQAHWGSAGTDQGSSASQRFSYSLRLKTLRERHHKHGDKTGKQCCLETTCYSCGVGRYRKFVFDIAGFMWNRLYGVHEQHRGNSTPASLTEFKHNLEQCRIAPLTLHQLERNACHFLNSDTSGFLTEVAGSDVVNNILRSAHQSSLADHAML